MNVQLIFNFFILFIINLICTEASGQNKALNIERNELDSLDSDYGYYLAVKPNSNNIKGAILLMPGFGQKAEAVFKDSDLSQFASEKGLLTIAYSTGMRMFADTFMVSHLNQVLDHVKSTYNVPPDKFVFGGFSAGGTIVLRYAELCKQFPKKHVVDPAAVFMADAPVDIFYSWDMMQELKNAALSKISVDEANWVEKMYLQDYGTTPSKSRNTFIPFNPFFLDGKDGENEQFLQDVAIRAYHDVDITWRLNNRNQSVKHSNYLVTSALIGKLLKTGNNRAEFIQTYQTGYRTNGDRHPHSWSIIDERECILWISEILDTAQLSTDSSKQNDHVIIPFAINKQNLSGLNLKRGRNPAQPDRILYFQNIFQGTSLNVQIVSSENASASPENLELDEFLFLTNGAARLSPKTTESDLTFLSGDFFIVPRGYNGDWETIGAPTFHNEISITTVQRNAKPFDSDKTIPIPMDKRKLAGIGLTELRIGYYSDTLYEGHEITISVNAEKPQLQELKESLQEQIIYILAGTLTLWDTNGNVHNFVTGDFVIIPNGFKGTWQSKGQELFRTMKIFKSDF